MVVAKGLYLPGSVSNGRVHPNWPCCESIASHVNTEDSHHVIKTILLHTSILSKHLKLPQGPQGNGISVPRFVLDLNLVGVWPSLPNYKARLTSHSCEILRWKICGIQKRTGDQCSGATINPSIIYDGVIKWKHFPRYWPFVSGEFIGHRSLALTKASGAELWCFLWSAPEQTIE